MENADGNCNAKHLALLMTDLQQVFEQKKVENEFQNREQPSKHEGPVPPYQHLLDELKQLSTKRKSFNFQADQLEERLRKLQKNFYDDMTIVDNETGPGIAGSL